MNRTIIAMLVANAFALPAFAQSQFQLIEGSVGVGGIYTQERNTRDASKLNEYQDIKSGGAGYFDLNGRSDSYWLKGYGENIGRDDMYLDLKGGVYDLFKARFYTNWLTHNFAFDARTPYSGAGSAVQTATFPAPNPALWNVIDVAYKRRVYGGDVEWKTTSPWYVRADVNQVQFDGNKLYAAAQGTSPGNGYVDLVGPVDYKTDNLTLEGGYSAKDMLFNVSALWSKFDNANTSFSWRNGYFVGQDRTYTAPNNDYFKLSANGALRRLPLNSQLAARFTYATSESSFALPTLALTTGSAIVPTLPNVANFSGKEKNTTAALAWTAAPARGFDTKVYYNYYDRASDSTHVEYSALSSINCGGAACDAEFYEVTKNNAGIDLAWRFMPGNRLAGGWDYLKTDRERTDYPKSTENRLWAEWRMNAIEMLSTRLRYQYSKRRSDFGHATLGANANDVLFLQRYVATYDASDRNQNLVKAVVDFSPAPFVDLSFEGIYKDNEYPTTVLGRTKDKRSELYAAINFGAPDSIRMSFFGDFEKVTLDAYHRNIGAGSCTNNCFDPFQPPNSTAYNWSSQNKDRNWLLGAAVAVPVTEALKLTGSLMYTKNSGSADFVSQSNFGAPVPITAYDNYKQSSFNLRADWRINRMLELIGGYTYQKYDYSDAQYDGYTYTIGSGSGASYLNGVGAFPQYKANIFYVVGKYHF